MERQQVDAQLLNPLSSSVGFNSQGIEECLGFRSYRVCLGLPRADAQTRLEVQGKHHEGK